jgi:hypothetical protein
MNSFNRAMDRLSRASSKNFLNPAQLEWPDKVDVNAWHFTPELISLYDSPVWRSLDEATRQRLSFYEAVNFFSLNIHGEKYLISEVSRRLYQDDNLRLNQYLLHFIEEESKHMMYFSNFCQRYAQKVYADKTLALGTEGNIDLDTFLLFARIYLFEEIVDEYNRIMAADNRIAGIAREINRIHHVEEARHLAFGRKFLSQQLSMHNAGWNKTTRAQIKCHLESYLTMIWKQYYNPQVYADAGIENAFEVWQNVTNSPVAIQHRQKICNSRLGLMRKLNLIEV